MKLIRKLVPCWTPSSLSPRGPESHQKTEEHWEKQHAPPAPANLVLFLLVIVIFGVGPLVRTLQLLDEIVEGTALSFTFGIFAIFSFSALRLIFAHVNTSSYRNPLVRQTSSKHSLSNFGS